MAVTAKFSVGDHVNYPAARNHSFPAGTGVVEAVHDVNGSGKYEYLVRADSTGDLLSELFREMDLTLVA